MMAVAEHFNWAFSRATGCKEESSSLGWSRAVSHIVGLWTLSSSLCVGLNISEQQNDR